MIDRNARKFIHKLGNRDYSYNEIFTYVLNKKKKLYIVYFSTFCNIIFCIWHTLPHSYLDQFDLTIRIFYDFWYGLPTDTTEINTQNQPATTEGWASVNLSCYPSEPSLHNINHSSCRYQAKQLQLNTNLTFKLLTINRPWKKYLDFLTLKHIS